MIMRRNLLNSGPNWVGRSWRVTLGNYLNRCEKKYCQSRFGRIAIADDHVFKAKTHGFFISPYLQDLMARAGVSDVYSESNDLLRMFLCIEVATTQVFRVTNALGEALEDQQEQAIQHAALPEGEVVYASMDGSMILTQAGWKEVKLGRIFPGSAMEAVGKKKRNRIVESIYSACLGSCHEFLPRFEATLGPWADQPEQLVFITDGAEWIRHYIQDRFPQAIHILDYFHAVEKLAEFAKMMFPDETRRQRWLEGQEAELHAGNVAQVLETLGKLVPLTKTAREAREALKTYYRNNVDRMAYGQYRTRGLMIGSGPMEAAHRTVLQARMKRSGQHWSTPGAKNVINLRVALKSGRWLQAIQPLVATT